MSARPVTPEEALSRHETTIPDAVFEVFNALLCQKADGTGTITVLQSEIVEALCRKGFLSKEIFDNRWLDIEPAYRRAGWEVEYDKPGFNEAHYSENWKFSFKGTRRWR